MPAPLFAQPRQYSIEVFGAYTTSSKLFPYATDPSDTKRAFFLPLNDIFNFGAEVRASINSLDLQVGLGTEFIQKSEIISVSTAGTSVPVRDGFRVIPVELTGYFRLPIGNERFHVYLGGGMGIYEGERIYQYGTLRAGVIDRTGGFGIHIVCGGEYSFSERWSLRTAIKVRDIHFESVNQFSQSSLIYEGVIVPLPQEAFSTQFDIDGLSLRTGIAYTF